MRPLALSIVFLAVTSAADAQNWPSFRGAGASGVADGYETPVTWDVEKGTNVLWKVEIQGISVSSPIVWGDRVFVTTAVSSDPTAKFRHGLYGDVEPSNDVSRHSWKLYALDKKTGKVVWEKVAHEGVPKTKRHPKSSQASCTPATDGKHVVALFGSEGLFAYDMDGKLLWKQDLGNLNAGWFFDPDYEWGVAASPILYKDSVIIQADIQKGSFVAAYSLKDGKRLWLTPREEIPSWATPTVIQGPQRAELVTHATTFIRGYDPDSGKELWRLSGNSEIATPTPFFAHGLIFVTNGYRGIQPIYAIRPGASGDITLKEGQDKNESIAWSKRRGGPYTPTPLIYGDHLYIVNNQGVLTVYEAKTGTQLYQQRLGEKGGAYSASVVAGDGKVYFTSEDGEVYVIRAGPKYEQLAVNNVGEVCMASPALSDGLFILRTMKHVMAIGAKPPVARPAND